MNAQDLAYLKAYAAKCRYDIARMIKNANSGHIGGALSSVDIYCYLQSVMDADSRLVVSHGHTSAGIYAALGNRGYFDIEECVASFRKRPPYEGHPSLAVNGIDWCSGSLGQGLSIACGFALAKKLRREPGTVYCVMGDGEQGKGQLQEAREFAVKNRLDNLIAFVDFNGMQLSGSLADITPQSIADKFAMSGWTVVEADGHDFESLEKAVKSGAGPLCVMAHTVMSKGIPAIENDWHFHGALPKADVLDAAIEALRPDAETLRLVEAGKKPLERRKYEYPTVPYKAAAPYEIGSGLDVRSAMGNVLKALAEENPDFCMAALDCDLVGSVKLNGFAAVRPEAFIECGIAEHNAVSVAAAMAKSGVAAVQADFATFNICETYGQNRMNDLNKAPVKIFSTHAGLDVGEDGKTHHCIDYISLLSNLFGFKLILPADANQAECAGRYAFSVPEAVAIVAGRSKLPVLADADGKPLGFEYGKGQWLRRGKDGVIVVCGSMVSRAVAAADKLKEEGLAIGVLNISTPTALDGEKLAEAAATGLIVTYEDHNVRTGLGTLVASHLMEHGLTCRFVKKGITKYGSSASPETLYAEQGLDAASVAASIKELLQ